MVGGEPYINKLRRKLMKKKKKKMKMNQSSSSSCSSSTSSTTTVPNGEVVNLTEDLIMEIFTNLPPISLLRFKCLSKTFHSLISNPDFLRSNAVHQFRRRQDPSLPPIPCIIFRQGYELSGDSKVLIISPSTVLHGDGDDCGYPYSQLLLQNLIDYGPEHDQPPNGSNNDQKVKFTVIDSCNGLLLYLNYRSPRRGKCIWYVCNPITKDYIKLPPLPLEEEEQGFKILDYSCAKLVFDPSLSLTYKVVIWLREYEVWNAYKRKNYEAWKLYVYSSETRSWRLSVSTEGNDFLLDVLYKQFNDFDFRAVLLNGVLYWTTLSRIMDVSLCYDVEKDLVWTLKFPEMPVGYVCRELLYFGVCGGGLRLIEKYYKPYDGDRWGFDLPYSFDVMEMNQLQLQQQHQDHQDGNIDKDLWTVKYRVNIGDQEGYYANLISKKSVFGVFILDLYKTTTKAGGEGEEVLMCRRNHHNDCLVISFNLSDNTFGKELQHRDEFPGFTRVLRYANITLFPLIH